MILKKVVSNCVSFYFYSNLMVISCPRLPNIINLDIKCDNKRTINDIIIKYQEDLVFVYLYSLDCLSHHDFQQQQLVDFCQQYSRVWLIYLNADTYLKHIPYNWKISSYPILLLFYQQYPIRHIIPTHPNLNKLLKQYYRKYIMREGLHHHLLNSS